jgi:hypothetical protein
MKAIVKTELVMSKEEFALVANIIGMLEDIYYEKETQTQEIIEKEWRKQDLLFNVDDVLIAFETIRDLVAIVPTAE